MTRVSALLTNVNFNKAQFEQFVENYVSWTVERLDVESLESMVTDLLFREYVTFSQEHIVGEIIELYGDECAADLLDSVDPHAPIA
jgi:hypothetical protein